jgi:hypothetical protein
LVKNVQRAMAGVSTPSAHDMNRASGAGREMERRFASATEHEIHV